MPLLATRTRSAGTARAGLLLRNTSLSNRFARFLWTAPPTFRLATKATRRSSLSVARTNATKRGLTHLRPSRYTRSKSARRRSVGVRGRSLPERLSVKPRDGGVPCVAFGRVPPGRPWTASSRESRGSGSAGVDLAGTFFSFRYDSRPPTVRADLMDARSIRRFPSKRNQPCYSSDFSLSTQPFPSHPSHRDEAPETPLEFFLVDPNPIC